MENTEVALATDLSIELLTALSISSAMFIGVRALPLRTHGTSCLMMK